MNLTLKLFKKKKKEKINHSNSNNSNGNNSNHYNSSLNVNHSLFNDIRSTPINTTEEENESFYSIRSIQEESNSFNFHSYLSTPLSISQNKFPFLYRRRSNHSIIQSVKSFKSKRIGFIKQQRHLPDFETKLYCEPCNKFVQTRIRYKNGTMVWLMAFILFSCTIVLCWVPFYVKYFKDVKHFCPACGKCLGVSVKL